MTPQGLVLNTDYDWYSYLKSRPNLEEINFWLPSARNMYRAEAGTPVFFKLKKPHFYVAGFGYLIIATKLPAWLAWERFGDANGAANFHEMRRRIEQYRKPAAVDPLGAYEIGVLVLSDQTFFEKSDWVKPPADWSGQIVRGKSYSLSHGEGERIWLECRARTGERRLVGTERPSDRQRYGDPVLLRPRLGQESFRIAVLDAYGRACAVSHEHSLPALEAAHIKPFAEGGEHDLSNGLLLRSDIHRLYDTGYTTITPDGRFLASQRLKRDFANGRSYFGFDRQPVQFPRKPGWMPDKKLLEWHNDTKFLP